MKTMPLGQLLTDEQIEQVLDIIQHTARHERIAKLKEYLGQFKAELEHKGVVADYLAYMVEHLVQNYQRKGNQ